MLVYIIDGWNVVHKLKKIKTAARPRQALVDHIRKHGLTGSVNNKVIVVFDGFFPLDEMRPEPDYRIMFSEEREADDLIIEQIERGNNPKQKVVVSDDRKIVSAARLKGVKVLPVREFIALKKKKKAEPEGPEKNIKYSDQRDITEEMRKIWLNGDTKGK